MIRFQTTSEIRYRVLFDRAPLGLLVTDLDGHVIEANTALGRMLGFAPAELAGQAIEDLTYLDDRHLHRTLFQSLLSGECADFTFEKRYVKANGELLWAKVVVARILDELGVPRCLSMVEDVTERRRAESILSRSLVALEQANRAYAETQVQLRSVLDSTMDGIAAYDVRRDASGAVVDFIYRFVNAPGIAYSGRYGGSDAPIGKGLLEVYPPVASNGIFEAYLRVLETGEMFRTELFFPNEGTGEWFITTVVKAGDGLVATFSDVTAQKLADLRLREQLEALQGVDRMKTDFINAASHELRTPLVSIVAYAEFLEDDIAGSLTPDQRHFVSEIQDGACRLQRLIDDLLDIARLGAGTFQLNCQESDLGFLVQHEAEILQGLAERQGVFVAVRLPDAPLIATVDPGRFAQVVSNLITNGIKFSDAGGHVDVELALHDGHPCLSVRDDGIGISPENQVRLFEKFYQVDPSLTRTHGGAGIGLAICKAIVDGHGGAITFESAAGHGTVFRVSLPA